MRKTIRRKGYGLFLVIMALAFLGIAMILAANISNTMAFQSNQARLAADGDNLQASALAWAQAHADELKAQLGKPHSLDCAGLRASGGSATVTPVDLAGDKLRVRIETSCTLGRPPSRRSTLHVLD